MRNIISDMFSNEHEYYQSLIESVRRFVSIYIQKHVHASDTGLIKHSGGVVLYRDDLLTLSAEENDTQDMETARNTLLEEISKIRECAIRSIRSGTIIVLEYLFKLFELDEFEIYMVILAVCGELDHNLKLIFSNLSEQNGSYCPTLNLAIRMYTGNQIQKRKLQQRCIKRWETLSFLFPDFYEISSQSSVEMLYGLFEQKLKLDYRILAYLQNVESVDEALTGIVQYGYDGDAEVKLLIHQNIAKGMRKIQDFSETPCTFFLSGELGAGKKMQAANFCKNSGLILLFVDSKRLPEQVDEQKKVLRRIVREAILQGNAAICIYDLEKELEEEKISAEKVENILWGMRFWKGTLILTSQYEWNRKVMEHGRNIRKLMIPETTTEERMLLWDNLLPKELFPEDMRLDFLADKYVLSAGCIKNCIMEYKNRLYMEEEISKTDLLLEACRNQIDHRLGKDAIRIRAQYTWDDLVLPELQKKMLKDACDQVLMQHQVYHKWGFEKKVAYGRGVSMIFYGPPGTGKTMGAQVIANTLKLELYKVDMAGVMSKYVGESEKKLGNIFEQAKKSQSILFFDEADVLFGKRTDQKDSNDKYSNASTAYLLQKIEEYEGIIILATNLLQNFDNAFLRRFKFIVEFPFTDEKRRKEIWQKVFTVDMPKEEIDFDFLAQEFKFSGSQIKNVALAAAFLAAGENQPLNMKHILISVKREMAKTGKILIASDFGPYYYLMENQEV